MIRKVPADREAAEAMWFDLASGARCPPVDTLLPSLEGVLPEPLATRVREHIAECEACRTLVDVFDADGAGAIQEDETRSIGDRVQAATVRWRVPVRAAMAAAVVLAVAGAAVWLARGPRVEPRPAIGSARGDVLLPPPEYVLALAPPSIVLPESALVTRGTGADPYVAALKSGFDPLRRGEYAEAARRFDEVASAYTDRAHGLFYSGVSRLLAGRAADAVQPLEAAVRAGGSDAWLAAESSWYLAVALERTGRRTAAAEALSPVCAGAGVRKDAACNALRRLKESGQPRPVP
jgi:hypothetical protein